MTIVSFISSIKHILPEADWPWVFSALSFDPLVWESLGGDLGQRALDRNTGRATDFSPAALSLLALDFEFTAEELRLTPLQEVKLEAAGSGTPFSALAHAGMAALQLREARRSSASWEVILRQNGRISPTALACAYAIVPDPAELLRAAFALDVDGEVRPGVNPALHALLANPLQPQVHIEALNELLSDLPRSERLTLLGQVHRYRPDLAPPLAVAALNREPPVGGLDRANGLGQIEKMLRAARLHRLADDAVQALSSLEGASMAARRLQAELAAQTAQLTAQKDGPESSLPAWEEAVQLDPESSDHLAGLVFALLDAGRSAEAQSHLAETTVTAPHAGILLANARLALLQDFKENARRAAIQALEVGSAAASLPPALTGPEPTSLLLQLDAPYDAARAAELALRHLPNEPRLLSLLARARLGSCQPVPATQAAHLAVALRPQNPDYRRLLAECLELAGDWSAALLERSALLERTESPSTDDLRDLASCSLYAGQPEEAKQICQQLLENDANDGLTWTLLGQATAALGDKDTALEHLDRATQLSAESSTPWLALSQLYQEIGQKDRALETLQAAALSAPDLPEIQLALGEMYLAQGAATQALTSLREAGALCDDLPFTGASGNICRDTPGEGGAIRRLRDQIALRLGQTLNQLGHLADARQILEDAHQRAPADSTIALSYAQILLALGDLRAALSPLKTLVQAKPQEIYPYLEYARTILALYARKERDVPLEDAISAIRNAQEIDPNDAEATALLAEALAAKDELLPAMEAYRKALESDLAVETAWLARLSVGLGEVAQKLGQFETAIAALQEAGRADPANARIQRSLSEAYDAAGLTEDAYQAAQSALNLAPGDVENLSWFASQALSLAQHPGVDQAEAKTTAREALERATNHAPERGDLWVKLAEMRLNDGDTGNALAALTNLADPEAAASGSPAIDLYQAAQGLLQLGEAAEAVRCLERALQNRPGSNEPDSPSILEMLTALSQARYQVGDLQAALEAVDQAISLNPDEPSLHLDKANMLLELGYTETETPEVPGNTREALASLVTAMRLNPHDPDLHYRAALIHRSVGDYPAALAHTDQMVELSVTIAQAMKARALAGDLSLSMLQPAQAHAYLDGPLPPAEPAEPVEDEVLLDYHALRAELALESGDERGAVEELVRVLEIAPEDARLLAIQARILHHRDGAQIAQDALQKVLKAMGDPALLPVALIRSAAQSALELSQWEVALQLYERVMQQAPFEPRAYFDLGRALTLRSEFTRLCQALDAIQHADEPAAWTEETWQTVELYLTKAESLVDNWGMSSSNNSAEGSTEVFANPRISKWADPLAQIHRWRIRGKAAFHASSEAALALASLPPNPDDTAARVACLRQVGELAQAGLAARDYPQHPLVLLQLALALMDEKPRQAMAAIHAATDVLSQPSANRRHRSDICFKEIAPLVYALMARLFHNNGNRASDRESALQAILNALNLWPDEPQWHALAAEIYLSGDTFDGQSDLEAAISHLEQAIKFDPSNSDSLLVLGQIYLREGSARKAVQVFEQAAQIKSEEAEPWIWLAKAYRSLGDLENAAAHAERAVTLAPNQVQPLLLRGEIALQAENPRGAQSRAQAALRIQPEDPDALLLLARALNDLDRPDEALATLEKAMPMSAEPLPLSIERIRLLRRAHGPDTALQAAQMLVDHNPEEPRVLALQAELLESAGQADAAIQAAQRTLRLPETQASLPEAEQARLHFLLGRLLRRSGQLDQSVHHLSETIRLAPDLAEAYLEIGHVHQERRQHNQALNAYRQAITVAPHDHRAYYMIGLALKESKDYIGAEKMLRRAADLAPNDVSIHRLLGAVVALNLVHNRRESIRESSQTM
jgi:tetratricopeptide (TPR) repeat protein